VLTLSGRTVQGDWVGGVVFTTSKLPPLPLSTTSACTDFTLFLEEFAVSYWG
jgi:hypothetical protein